MLLRNVGTETQPEWEAKICDFGMDAEDLQAGNKDNQDVLRAESNARPGSQNKIWLGTFEYMSPEATGQDHRKFGRTGAPSDVFSYGIMLWEMLFGMRVRKGFGDRDLGSTVNKAGERVEDLKPVAVWTMNGSRPTVPEECPPPLRLLVEVCWKEQQAERVTFRLVVTVLQALCAAHGDGKLVDNVPASQELTYEDFLETLGLAARKQDLANFSL